MNFLLPTILHHANRDPGYTTKEAFYRIKNRLIKKYGQVIGYDVQFIEGKKCFSCGGTGIHHYYDWNGLVYDTDYCWHCHNGWYKRPMWVVLEVVRVGRFTFHQPKERVYKKPDDIQVTITGYIEHDHSDLNRICLTYIFLLAGDYKNAVKAFGFRHFSTREYEDHIKFVVKKAHDRLECEFDRRMGWFIYSQCGILIYKP